MIVVDRIPSMLCSLGLERYINYTGVPAQVTNRFRCDLYLSYFGIIGLLITSWKKRDFGPDKFFLFTLFIGGWAALLYNNIRLPYLERGILKVAFIYFTFPIGAMLAYDWWYKNLKEKWFWALLVFGPILIYTIVALPVLLVGIY